MNEGPWGRPADSICAVRARRGRREPVRRADPHSERYRSRLPLTSRVSGGDGARPSAGRGRASLPQARRAAAINRTAFALVAGDSRCFLPSLRLRRSRRPATDFGRFVRTSSTRQISPPTAHVDHMRTTSIPSKHSSFTNRLHIRRHSDRGNRIFGSGQRGLGGGAAESTLHRQPSVLARRGGGPASGDHRARRRMTKWLRAVVSQRGRTRTLRLTFTSGHAALPPDRGRFTRPPAEPPPAR